MEVNHGGVGIVSELDAVNNKIRVKWPTAFNAEGEEGTVSGWLFWMVRPGEENLPKIKDQVIVFYDQWRRSGIAMGVILKDGDSPFKDADIFGFKFEGIEIQITKSTGAVQVISNNEVNLKSTKVTIDADEVKITKKLVVGGESEFKGNVSAEGKIDAVGVIKSTSDVQAGVIKLLTHTHLSAAPGSPTGPALPT